MASSVERKEELDSIKELDSLSDDAPYGISYAPLALEDFEDDVFEDAKSDELDDVPRMSLQEAFEDCQKAMNYFFQNDSVSALKLMRKWSHNSLYHSLGTAIFEFIPAALTFDKGLLQRTSVAIKECVRVCQKHRKQYTLVESLGSIIKKPNFGAYTDLEAHAELCYAECLLLYAALNVIESDDLTGLIKSSLKIKTCYNIYQLCWNIKESKKFDTEESKRHFKSGVRLGTATFNLIISLLPPRLVALLEFVGFSGNKYYGLNELEKGSRAGGLRAILCDLTLLGYHLFVCQFVGGKGDMFVASNILHRVLARYPRSEWFLLFQARYLLVSGNLQQAIRAYTEIGHSPNTMAQFRHLCYWELMWIHSLRMDFRKAAAYADMLIDGSAWSKTTYLYIKAAMLMQAGTSRSDSMAILELLRYAPRYKQRIAGKSLPMEKFVIKRCARYHEQCCRLVLPAIEMLCIWNLLPLLRTNRYLLYNMVKVIERNTELLDTCEGEWWAGHKEDNKALLLFMHGCVLSALEMSYSAIAKFEEVLKMKRDIKEDAYIIPFSVCEIGWCHFVLGDMESAHYYYTEAKKKYSGYVLETRLHFRIHARLDMVRDIVGNMKFDHRQPPPTFEQQEV